MLYYLQNKINMGVPKTMGKKSSSGMSELGVLQLIFIVLKCIDVIDWPWSKVLIPLWIDLGLLAALIAYAVILELFD